jgi:phosphoesterase RecJ-like protein
MTTLSDAAVAVPVMLLDVLHTAGPVVICGHARPDGDSLGSVMAMAAALRTLGRPVRTVCSDPAPAAFLVFPNMDALEVTPEVDASGATVIVMESSALVRTGVTGLERARAIVNIDHHLGNTGYGTVNWFDEGAAACVEMVADAIDALGVAWTEEIATYLYLGLLTDTGGFRHSHISARTFELARRCVLAGADPVRIGQVAYDSFSLARVRLIGELLHGMALDGDGRLAVLTLTPDVHARAGSTPDETEGLINLPFTAQDIRAVCLLRSDEDGVTRVSLRSKGAVDVRSVAQRFGGGGHLNASGFTSTDRLDVVRDTLLPLLRESLK